VGSQDREWEWSECEELKEEGFGWKFGEQREMEVVKEGWFWPGPGEADGV
jgi:hypothetical protein